MAARNRQPFQFGLRGVLLLVALLCAGLGLGISFSILVLVAYVAYLKFVNGEVKWAFGMLAAMLIFTLFGVGVFVQIRLDTGDRRLVAWGIPVLANRMQSESREALLSIRNPKEPVRWTWCATSVASNHPDAMVRRMYKSAAVWVKADPIVARAIVRDLGEYLSSTHGMHGLPGSCEMLGPPVLIWEARSERVPDNWRSIPVVQDFLKRNGITAVVQDSNG